MKLSNVLTVILLLLGWYSQAQGDYILREDFYDNQKNWAVKTHKDASMYISNGHYYFSHKRTTGSWTSHRDVSALNTNKDWEIEIRMKHISGVNDYAYGMMFARKDNDNGYYFQIASNGYYRVKKSLSGNTTYPKKWTKSSFVKLGNNVYNTLKVKRSGSKWNFYVNGNFVYGMNSTSWLGDRVGISVHNKQAVEFDYFYVKQGSSSNYSNNYPNKNNNNYPNKNNNNYTNNNANASTILHDDFSSNKNNWALSNTDKFRSSLSNGHYAFEHKKDAYSKTISVPLRNFDSNGDWVIETKLKHTSGIQNNGFGLVFGRKSNWYQVEYLIAANGYYLIKRLFGENLKDYLNTENSGSWTKTSIVKQGNYNYNTLKIEKKGSKWMFYLNGSLVETTQAFNWSGNNIGFHIYKNQKIEVDYLYVKQVGGQTYVNNNNHNNNVANNTYNAAPSVTIYEPQMTRGLTVVKAKTVRVAGKATDTDGVFEVKINGLDAKLLSDGYFSLDVPLAMGQNTITVTATDTKRKSKTETFKMKREQNQNVVSNNTLNNNNQSQNQRRLALLIGNASYMHGGSLSNPVNDVRAMKTKLEQLGFTVLKFENCSQKQMRKAMDEFGSKLGGFDTGLFFYAGHGVQVDGSNYLVPTDAALKDKNDVEYDCVDAGRILGKMESSKTNTNIVILDACRDNPFERSWSRSTQGKGLAFMNAPSGSFIAYATSPGKTASDGIDQNGLYTASLLQHISTPGLTIEEVFKRVRTTVKKKSAGKQIPWESTSLEGTFKFK